jgi:hypothetical protein
VSDPGSGYVAVSSGVPVWLPVEVAERAVPEVSGDLLLGRQRTWVHCLRERGSGSRPPARGEADGSGAEGVSLDDLYGHFSAQDAQVESLKSPELPTAAASGAALVSSIL